MARRKKPEAPENHERWMVSYADFVTLLFAFFVVMFASSQADKGKAKQVSESVRQALDENQIAAVLAGILGGNAGDKGKGGPVKNVAAPPPEKIVELGPSQQALAEVLKAEIDAGKIHLSMEARGLVVSLREAAFFASGDDRIEPGAYSSIEKIAAAICKIPNPVRLEGHTDSVPIHNSRFRSNWELSAARGIAMLELLSTRYSVPRNRLAIVGYAENMPVADNESEEGRSHNRRVDVVLLNQRGLAPEPQPKAPPPKTAATAPQAHH
jgi:chemotaxis protein MotB